MDGVKLKMNTDKTEFILFGSRVQLQKCLMDHIEISGDNINHTSVIRYLGGFLDETASFSMFRDHVRKKCSEMLSIRFEK
jgi:hypothetical protein